MNRDFFFLSYIISARYKNGEEFYKSVRQQIKKNNEQYVSKSVFGIAVAVVVVV
jgi:hypothetical protein